MSMLENGCKHKIITQKNGGDMPDMARICDEGLCGLANAGHKDAEEALIVRYGRTVRRLSRPYFLAGGDGEDLLQEGMIALFRAIRDFDPEGGASFRTFAELCVRRHITATLRNAVRGKHTPLNAYIPIEDGHAQADGAGADPEQIYIAREELEAGLVRLRESLSGFEAGVLTRYLEGMTVAEMSEAFGRPYKSIDNAITRIRRKAAPLLRQGRA